MTTLEELEKLLKAGTPGPWEKSGVRTKCIIEDAISIGADGLAYIYLPIGKTHNEQAGALNDAALIVAAINALPGLLESARRVEKLEAALIKIAADDGLYTHRHEYEQIARAALKGT
jgi:hypothetical protein